MPRRLDKTLADYLVIAVSPALIMAMVGSLVFFLAELFYRGNYEGRLNFVLGCFVFAAVLIGRISIELGAERAAMYAMPLALATALAINKFVVEQGGTLGSLGLLVNLGLLGFVWWAAHKLVWDCTLIDETQDSSGEGLLQRIGLVRREANDQNGGPAEAESTDEPPADEPEPPAADEPGHQTWWQRLRDAPRKPHAPGVWIVYFSLAALPIFGIGQAFIPAPSLDQRRYVFVLLVVYVASGLGLLLTTSFLGLRRYLRQRRLQMPITMAGVWITIGVALIAAILGLAILLPRPSAEYTLADLPIRFTSPEQKASRYAAGKEGTDDRRPDRAKVTQDDPDKPKTGAPKDSPGGSAEGKQSESKGGEGKSGEGKAGQGKGEEGKKGRTDDSSKPPPGKQDTGQEQGDAKQSPQQPGEKQPETKREPERSSGGSRDPGRKTRSSQPSQESKGRGESKPEPEQKDPSSAAPQDRTAMLREAMGWIATLGKWIFYGGLALVVLIWIVWNRQKILEEIRRILAELRQLWQWLFGGKPRQAQGAIQEQAKPQGPAPRRLADFADPFATGEAARLSPDELVRYSFEALEAWAREHGCPRSPDETPHELAQQVAVRDAALARDARTLATLYCRVAYAPGTLPAAQLEPLRQFWRQVLACSPS